MDPIISWAKFSVLFFSLSFLSLLYARETFEFNLGQKINVLSDKAFRKTSENEFEAVGNVVITHLNNSIYGEKARINFTTGEGEILGNVRYIAPMMTLYGTKLKYNFLTRQIDLDNARVLSENFVVTGKKILQNRPEVIFAEEAEYTTCRDCPESWSVFGKKVKIDVGQYVTIHHAFVKVNGVIAMYFPYIVFPIKQRRESGLLFPLLGFNSKEGFRYQQPFFWAIDDYKDSTITPSTFGNRGLGGEIQYRQNLKEKTWLEVNTLQLNDQVYEPYKRTKEKSNTSYYRHFSDFEFHSIYKHKMNNHFYFLNASDLDTVRDLDFFAKERIRGTEIGGGGFFEGRNSLFTLTTEGYFNRNMFIADPRVFDDHYVQILPKITLSSVPFNLVHTDYPFLKNIALGWYSDLTIFKQNKYDVTGPIRNARRVNLAPYLNWQLGNLGPVFFNHQQKVDYQSYYFPTEQHKSFSKKGLILETEAKFELEKVFGLAYTDEERIDQKENTNDKKSNATTIGSLPAIKGNKDEAITIIKNNSYRHSQEFKLKHYYLSNQKYRGNLKFKEQIQDAEGQFDYVDALREREQVTNQVTLQDSLPLSNTVEFQWNNRLIRKMAKLFDPYIDNRYLKDNFDYDNIAYFEASQGFDFNVKSDKLKNHLTRLYLNTGLNFDKISFALQEFYFHQTSDHSLSSTASYHFSRATVGGKLSYSTLDNGNAANSATKLAGYNVALNLSDLVSFKNSLDYNMQTKRITESYYSVLYAPLNNCWKIEFSYARDLIDKRFGVLFYINYNENNFTAINVR